MYYLTPLQRAAIRDRAEQINQVLGALIRGYGIHFFGGEPPGVSPYRWLAMRKHLVKHGVQNESY